MEPSDKLAYNSSVTVKGNSSQKFWVVYYKGKAVRVVKEVTLDVWCCSEA